MANARYSDALPSTGTGAIVAIRALDISLGSVSTCLLKFGHPRKLDRVFKRLPLLRNHECLHSTSHAALFYVDRDAIFLVWADSGTPGIVVVMGASVPGCRFVLASVVLSRGCRDADPGLPGHCLVFQHG